MCFVCFLFTGADECVSVVGVSCFRARVWGLVLGFGFRFGVLML
jgi:hypothetical protein